MTCHKCQFSFDIPTKEYDRQIRNGRFYFFCSRSCAQKFTNTTTHKIWLVCLWCKKKFESTTHKKGRKCCNNLCARRYAQSKVNPKNHKESTQRNSIYPTKNEFECVICHTKFSHMVKSSVEKYKTCSQKCLSDLISKNSRENPNCGGKLGYRRFKYKGFSMDSRWEVDLAKWMDEKGIVWDRSRKRYLFMWMDENGKFRKYFPDFYLPVLNVYLDPKNDFYLQRDLPKLKYVISHYKIRLLYGNPNTIKQSLDVKLKV